jgi:hypothetical protein
MKINENNASAAEMWRNAAQWLSCNAKTNGS